MTHKALLATWAAAGALAGLAGTAQAAPAIVAGAAPPAAIHEAVPAPREGHTWVPGHYEWRNGQYTWMQGYWLNDRPGYEWREAEWVQRSDGSWALIGGDWVRDDRRASSDRYGPWGDLDRDGVRNRDDRDRDGDGVANRYDREPDDPYDS